MYVFMLYVQVRSQWLAVPAVALREYYGTDAGGGQAEDSTPYQWIFHLMNQ